MSGSRMTYNAKLVLKKKPFASRFSEIGGDCFSAESADRNDAYWKELNKYKRL